MALGCPLFVLKLNNGVNGLTPFSDHAFSKNIFFFLNQNIRTVSMRRFFLASNTYVKTDENIKQFCAQKFCLSKPVLNVYFRKE